jgi:hypothetical protein
VRRPPVITGAPTFRIESTTTDGRTRVALHGVIDEHADLAPIAALRGDVELNMSGIRRINSFGVRAWMEVIRQVSRDVRMRFVECPSSVVDQMNMVRGFLGHGALVSFYAPLMCEDCDRQSDQLFEVERCRALGGRLPDVPCPGCARPMLIDDLEDQYLLFVREPAG